MAIKNLFGEKRGAALVEFSVVMVALLPMILIPLYLQDGVQYKLLMQERVFSTAWDFAYGNYQDHTIDYHKGSILSENEKIFKNGKSGNDRDKNGHASPWSDFRWPQQAVDCSGDESKHKPSAVAILASNFHDRFTKGGQVTCEGSIEVANFYVPQHLEYLTFKKNKDFFKKQGEYVTFSDGAQGGGQTQPLRFGLLVDPWTIHNPNDVRYDTGNEPFLTRTRYCWKDAQSVQITYNLLRFRWFNFFMDAVSYKLLSPLAFIPQLFDDPPPMISRFNKMRVIHPIKNKTNINPSPALSNKRDFWVSPYKDGKDNMYEKTYNARKFTYLGCDGALDDGNC